MNKEEALLKLEVMQMDSERYMSEIYNYESFLILKQKHQEVVDYIKENLK
jgi:hypothetical protein